MSLKLYTYPGNVRASKALIAAKYVGVTIDVPAFEFGVANKTPEFAAKNPFQKVPVLETPAGCIFESNAIARYVARMRPDAQLFGVSFQDAGVVDQWLDVFSNEFDTPIAQIIYPIMGYIPPNKPAQERAAKDVHHLLAVLDTYLMTRTYMVGEKITLADIVGTCSLLHLFRVYIDMEKQDEFVNVTRWFSTCINQPEFAAVLGPVTLCEKAPEAAAAKKEEKKKEEKKKEEKPKEEKKPKKEEPKEEEPEDEDYGDEDGEKKSKKPPNPLDLLPKSSMVFDEWKKMYSNNDTLKVAMPWFWEHLDKEGYSLWFGKYKYNEENNKLFMTCNLVGGWLQRADKLRKYGFGCVLIVGEEPALEISCVWLFRGQGVPAEMAETDDYVNYDWRKLDADSDADKKLVEAYWSWPDVIDGKRFREGKVFK
mmetsp:Transcript_26830/g.46257  ORF Transcript_26830/g.46257 Transcript_26830/m.46257 type:complete len:424 (+) Transcript_26830:81-1352(+)|eukprot:CAMPEP_0196652288 /NCGR_PEP_ID=MMETSP1086-20130531/1515_1 /TAXON_ID=77921 /ORGANISM="Cyanoptyche  gloeocystis , Strain SAG4.97" /LENGTH=423 /DNA_ID=CAMNT_0041982739 /DNA_START=62 /DNA_END=1333 /DNA_ORIENTATION=+